MPARSASEPTRVRKARRLELARHATRRDLARAAFAEGRAHFDANARHLLPTQPPALVHQARVALRRLRVFVRLFRAELESARAQALSTELRWLFQRLGAVRDRQVFAHDYAGARLASTPAGRSLRARLRRSIESARRELDAALRSARFRRLCDELAALDAVFELPGQGEKRARPWLTRRLKKCRKRALGHFEALLRRDLEELHTLRKELKKLRYTAELARELYTSREKRARKYLSRLSDLQDALGTLIDMKTAREQLAQLNPPAALRTRFAIRFERESATRFSDLDQAFQRFADATPFWT
jgi:triphosphatase